MRQEINLDLADARRAIDRITTEVAARGKAAVVAVADSHGELIALARMDGAPLSSITIATNKAYSAARERKPSKELGTKARDPQRGFDMGFFGDRKFTGWGGGIPVFRDGIVAGAVAVSGMPEAEDIEVVELGIAAILEA